MSCTAVSLETDLVNTTTSKIINDTITLAAKCNRLLTPLIHNIRISLSPTDSVPTTSLVSQKIYIHAYNGEGISLYSTTYNSWLVRKIIYTDNNAPGFALVDTNSSPLSADTNYDIFIGYDDNTQTFVPYYAPWSDSSYNTFATTNTQFSDGICTLKSDIRYRYIGCLRTTAEGTTEQSFGERSLKGSSPKLYLWNYKNETIKNVSNITTGLYSSKQLVIGNDCSVQSRTAESNEQTDPYNYNRLDFIIGRPTYVECTYTNYFESSQSTTVFSSILLDQTTYTNASACPASIACTIGCTTAIGRGTTTSILKGTIPSGLHFIQTFDTSNLPVTYNPVDDGCFRNGFTVRIID